jgi:hypothetical protein
MHTSPDTVLHRYLLFNCTQVPHHLPLTCGQGPQGGQLTLLVQRAGGSSGQQGVMLRDVQLNLSTVFLVSLYLFGWAHPHTQHLMLCAQHLLWPLLV